MSINKNISKLLYALSIKGQLYKINNFQFYSDSSCKYCSKYQIFKKEKVKLYDEKTGKIEEKEKYKNKKECYSKVDIMKYLIKEYKEGSEADGK